MALVIADLGAPRIFFVRLLVDEGTSFREHAVAYLGEERAPLVPRLRKLLSMARPTQVTAVSLDKPGELTLVGEDPNGVETDSKKQARYAAAAVAFQVLLTLPSLAELSLEEARALWTGWFAEQTQIEPHHIALSLQGREPMQALQMRVERQGQFFEVSL